MHGLGAALLLLAALGCSPRVTHTTPNATTVTPPPPASATAPADAGGTTQTAEPPAAAYAPTFDQEMACRRRHCYTGGAKHCLDICYKYSHPMHPDRYGRCSDSCRSNYGIQACDDACGRDRRAFSWIPATVPPRCRTAMHACRRDCSRRPPNSCELHCLVLLERCESQSAK